MNALEKIWEELKSGTIFGDICEHRMGGTYFWEVLWIAPSRNDPTKKFIFWRNYGQSANKMTKKDLAWVLKEIFKMSPAEFLFRYTNYEEYCRIKSCYRKDDAV